MVGKRSWIPWLLVATAACGPDASNDAVLRTTHACAPGVCADASTSQTAVDGGVGHQPLEPWPDSNAGLVSGVYALHAVATATVGPYIVSLQLVYRLRILQQTSGANNTRQSTTLCAIKLPSVPNIATLTIPPRLAALVPAASAIESEGNYLSTRGATLTYAPPPLLLVLGARLKNSATDPLPSLTDTSTEWDEDLDGHPGVTVDGMVVGCQAEEELYVALRTGGQLSGTISAQDTIDGTMSIFEAESVVGFSNSCLALSSSINPHLSPETTFHAQRLASEEQLRTTGNVSCADIIAEAPKLYGSAWSD